MKNEDIIQLFAKLTNKTIYKLVTEFVDENRQINRAMSGILPAISIEQLSGKEFETFTFGDDKYVILK